MKTSHPLLLAAAILSLSSCTEDVLQVNDTNDGGSPLDLVETVIAPVTYKDSIALTLSSGIGGPDSVHVDFFCIDGRRISYSKEVSFSDSSRRDTLLFSPEVLSSFLATGKHTAEFNLCLGPEIEHRMIEFNIIPSETGLLGSSELFRDENTIYNGGICISPVESGLFKLQLGQMSTMLLKMKAGSAAATGLYSENFRLSLDAGSDIAIDSYSVKNLKYIIEGEGYQICQDYFLSVSLFPIRIINGVDSLRIGFWDEEKAIGLKVNY